MYHLGEGGGENRATSTRAARCRRAVWVLKKTETEGD